MLSLVGAILAIGLLIMVHEAGHYFVAKWCNMRVDRFSIGFGPPILKWRRGETDFTIGPILFGGFVQINGMTLVDDIDPDDPRQYPNRPVWQRFAAIFAGPATNYMFAIVLAFSLYSVAGMPSGTHFVEIGGFAEGVESVGGLQVGDRILRVGDELLYGQYENTETKALKDFVQESKGSEMIFTVLRGGEELVVKATPTWHEPKAKTEEVEESAGQYLLGVTLVFAPERVGVGVGKSFVAALNYPIRQTKIIGGGLYDIITGKQEGEVVGPVGIGTIAKKQFDAGWMSVFGFLMILNVNLGLFNLLPLPALDGGRLMFLGYEMATRKRANPKVEATVHMIGIMGLLLIMVLVTYKDIARLF